MPIDWDQTGTLRSVDGDYDIRTDPLWVLVMTAKQGHEGPLASMHIRMVDGTTYAPDEIAVLAQRPDRKWT